LAEANLRNPQAVREAIRAALAQVGGSARSVSLILPDLVVRVFVLDFEAFPAKAAEAVPILRFRLRKMVPFDVELASLSYQILTATKTETRILVAVLPGAVLAEYEAAVRQAGYEPGAVLASSLAALDAVSSSAHGGSSLEANLSVQLSRQSLTTCICSGNDLLLYRSMELPEDEAVYAAEVQRGVAVAIAYFEDKLHASPGRIFYSGELALEAFAQMVALGELPIEELVPHPATGLTTTLGMATLAGVTGALAGAH